MGNAKKGQICKYWEKRSWNLTIKMEQNSSSEEGIKQYKKEGRTFSTIETKFYKFGNKVSMLDTSNEADEEKITKQNNISFSRDSTASFT